MDGGVSQAPERPTLMSFEKLTSVISEEFIVREALMEHDVPTYYLEERQETKRAFLRLLKKLDAAGLMATLRRVNGRVVLKVFSKPSIKPSNVMINWLLFFATIGTIFYTGCMISRDLAHPLIGGITFTVATMAVLGMHEVGHKLMADKVGVKATPPYFIPGPPPIGTFGAAIMQKSLPPNKDALFDVGASGPIIGFFVSVIVTVIGLPLSVIDVVDKGTPVLPAPMLFWLIARFSDMFPRVPPPPGKIYVIKLHPVAMAGWIGLLVTMLNLLPAAMLDGGHVARSTFGKRTRIILTALSITFLIYVGFIPMAILVLLMSMYKHPGALDDVSSLSRGRKLLMVALAAIFTLSSFLHVVLYELIYYFTKLLR